MKRSGRQQVKTRQSKVFKLPQGMTFFLAGVIVLFLMGGGVSRPNQSLLWVVVALSAATPLAWWWAIHAVRIQNAAGKTPEEVKSLAPDVFEEWVAARFRDLGYAVKLTGAHGDHGIDLIAEKPGETAVVQCKNYKAWSVGEPVLSQLLGSMHKFGADRAYLVTTGRLTRAAEAFAVGEPIEVWDGAYVTRLSMQMASAERQAGMERPALPASVSGKTAELTVVGNAASGNQAETAVKGAVVRCPKCGSQLVKRQNRRTGESFLGCSKYPACRYTQPWSVGLTQ